MVSSNPNAPTNILSRRSRTATVFFAILLSVVTMACVRSTFPLKDLSKENAFFIDPDTSTRTPIINDCGVDEGGEDRAMPGNRD